MSIEFSPENKQKFQKIVAKYETTRSALLPVLYIAQDQFGFLSKEVMDYVADLLQIPRAAAYEAVSFYSMFKKKDMGTYCIQICNNITCCMMGSEEMIAIAKEELGISQFFETTADKKFSLVPVQCLGSCDTGPVAQVNEDPYLENLKPEKFREYLRQLKGASA